MAKSGRALRISRDSTAIVGARTDNFTINNEPVDITDKDDDGWRTLLADAGLRSISADVEGVLKDATLIGVSVGTASALLESCELDVDGIATFTGNFLLTNLALGAEQGDAITFTANLESSGTLTTAIGPYNTVAPVASVAAGPDLSVTNGTWAGDATITFATQWQTNSVSSDVNSPLWTNATEVAAEAAYDAGDFVRARITASNSVGDTIAFSNVLSQ
jgi:predicted secreted protein